MRSKKRVFRLFFILLSLCSGQALGDDASAKSKETVTLELLELLEFLADWTLNKDAWIDPFEIEITAEDLLLSTKNKVLIKLPKGLYTQEKHDEK